MTDKPSELALLIAAADRKNLYSITGDVKDINTVLISRAELDRLREVVAPPVPEPTASEREREAFQEGYAAAQADAQVCELPPRGWRCTRAAGHDGPCAAIESPEDVTLVAKGMKRLREATHTQPASEPVAWVLYYTNEHGVSMREPFFSKAHMERNKSHNETMRGLACRVVPLYATPQPAAAPAEPLARDGWVMVPVEVVKFLIGEGPLDGLWFGEHAFGLGGGKYWWRKHLHRAALAASPTQPRPQPDPLEKLTRENERLGLYDDMQPTRLSDGQIDAIFNEHHNPQDEPWTNWRRFARAIEAKGITAQESTE